MNNRYRLLPAMIAVLVASLAATIFGVDDRIKFLGMALCAAGMTLVSYINFPMRKKLEFRVALVIFAWLMVAAKLLFPGNQPVQDLSASTYLVVWMAYLFFGDDDGKPKSRKSVRQRLQELVPVAMRPAMNGA